MFFFCFFLFFLCFWYNLGKINFNSKNSQKNIDKIIKKSLKNHKDKAKKM